MKATNKKKNNVTARWARILGRTYADDSSFDGGFRNKWHRNGKDIMMYGYWEISNEKKIIRRYETTVPDEDKKGAGENEISGRKKKKVKERQKRERECNIECKKKS